MYPLKFHPILKERLWGGTKLKEVLNKPIESDITGESWELSGVEGDISEVSNGELAGTSLTQLIDDDAEGVLGTQVIDRFGTDFPILLKFIDAKQDLSVQLHPDDELATKRHNSNGKTEMWYIMDADDDANIIVGFNRDISKKEYTESLEKDTLLELLNYEKVDQGDAFFIHTGKVHGIGAGVLLAEIQQTSDITYRIYDYNRKDKEGNLRELHTDLALDAIDYEKKDDFKMDYSSEANMANPMVDCPYFRTDFLRLTDDWSYDVSERDSFTILMCVKGSGRIANENGTADIKKGETVLVPALSRFLSITTDGMELLQVTL
ncbi:type I phosphomannose isomerase catalytic subunit [Pricia sp. S334]|uniref:Phosphohexomutase n=1 Tax=Pricia mediterranea TaxID=3076079 RepID=A0ABU3L2E2_9FLAO|nr:type I phosphomannose isomerase catalytic subunit [Pricia sp. S334]MDT7827805.1 type I phosphomannose isomerase catalytic subunit [Pricia sp. S334]